MKTSYLQLLSLLAVVVCCVCGLSQQHLPNAHYRSHYSTHSEAATDHSTDGASLHENGRVQHNNWHRLEMMDPNGLYWLEWWTKANSKEIHFRVTVNTRGFIGLGFSRKSGKMAGSDLVLLWVDDRTGKANVLVSLRSITLSH